MTVQVALLDYGAGNLRSARRGLERAGAQVTVTDDASEADRADALVVPGVGHFGACLDRLRDSNLDDLVVQRAETGGHVLGICVGMQLLYEHSEEGDRAGLGVLPGRVVRLPGTVRVPHMGWNVVRANEHGGDDPLLAGVDGERAYFVHSYHAAPTVPDHVVATCRYPDPIPAVVRAGATVGVQFHPEKSGDVGARLLSNWIATVRTPVGATS